MRFSEYEEMPPVKTSLRLRCTRNCFSTMTSLPRPGKSRLSTLINSADCKPFGMLKERSTFIFVSRSVYFTIGTEAPSSTRIVFASAMPRATSSVSRVRSGRFSQRPAPRERERGGIRASAYVLSYVLTQHYQIDIRAGKKESSAKRAKDLYQSLWPECMDQVLSSLDHLNAYCMLTGCGQDILVEVIDLLVESDNAGAVVVVWHLPWTVVPLGHHKHFFQL